MIKDQLSDNSHLLHRQDRLVQALPEPHVKSRKVPLFVGCRALRFRNSERIYTCTSASFPHACECPGLSLKAEQLRCANVAGMRVCMRTETSQWVPSGVPPVQTLLMLQQM